MKKTYQQQHAVQLSKILGQLPKSADDIKKRFVQQFYSKAFVSDLEYYDAKRAVDLAESAYEFVAKRTSSAPKIRLLQENKHTVIELLNDDMPFLLDSLAAELARLGLTVHETIHPILNVHRDKKGMLLDIAEGKDAKAESFIHFKVSNVPDNLTQAQLKSDLESVLDNIRSAVEDWPSITQKVASNIEHLESVKAHFGKNEIAEVEDFLRWLANRNFVFLGYAEYDFFDNKGKATLTAVPGSKLGVLRLSDDMPQGLETMPVEFHHFLLAPQLIEITKSNRRSAVHRPVLMDYIGLKRFDTKGKVIGEARFLGLFTSNVYYQSADEIPLVRQKIARVLKRADFPPASHDGKSLKTILEFLPRDEIFQTSDDDLFETSMGILALEARPGVRVFVRKDVFERFVSTMVFVPREHFSTELRKQIQAIIEKAYNGSASTFNTQINEAPLARLHVITKTKSGEIPDVDLEKLEQEIARRAYLWEDLLRKALEARHKEQETDKLHRAYANAFPQNYINRYDSDAAAYDIEKIQTAIASGGLALELFHLKAEEEKYVHLKIYNPHEEIALSDILPTLENAGFRVIEEHPFLITPNNNAPVWIRDFKLETGAPLLLEKTKPLIEEALLKVWRKELENDRFNTLVMKAELQWREVVMLRAYAKYLKQIGFTYAQSAVEQAMNQNPQITRHIVALFAARFDLDKKDKDVRQQTAVAAIEKQLADVTNAISDRILRRYVEIIQATLRTNYYQDNKPVLSFKFDSSKVPELPLPRPYAEIFVYSPRVEGIHLRGGKVARGGLRWSDRHEDFRTEILGLMKAQMVKNSVIVPVGSKGGFVVKQPTAGLARETVMEEGIACYKLYLSGLLDITDNIVNGKVSSPKNVIRHDEDDPYLVVAADKGTATFSDIANGVSADYNFWLGDAFASGGSAGYDHKKMAITARGAWVSVTRHFSEMGIDIAKQDFTVVGIGDMAGDVFGNGMLLSEHIQLVAAFNHMHIFLDPSPDAKSSFAERKRLFNLPRSSWKDYDAKLISKGGGIFERSAKSISLSKEAQAALGVSKSNFTPDDLIRAILLAPVDLLWNGGIGTYVKAEDETHEQVGDRANNSLRVNGNQLRCKVMGEGGNLGFTQKGRIEYAKNGGRINTDAIDNSAGVDCSDHEVNIKIAFAHEMAKGALTLAKRDKLLASMTDEVARLVLKDNIRQTQALTIAEQQGGRLLESQTRLMHALEKQGLLDRTIEFLPNDKQLAELKAAQKGLTRPELAVLLAYSKMVIYKDLLESNLPDEAYFADDLRRYFPKAMQADFADAIAKHRLKREIIATVMTNSLVNRAGITFAFDVAAGLSAGMRDIASAFTTVRDGFGLRKLWQDIEGLSADVPVAAQAAMYQEVHGFIEHMVVWLLRNLSLPLNVEKVFREMAPGIAEINKNKDKLHSEASRQIATQFADKLKEQSVPGPLAEQIASLRLLSSACDIIAMAQNTKLAVVDVGRLYFALGSRLQLSWLREAANQVTTGSRWDRLALDGLAADLSDEQRRMTLGVLERKQTIEAWIEAHAQALERFDAFLTDLKSETALDIAKLSVALRHVKSL